jgi:predicted ATPase
MESACGFECPHLCWSDLEPNYEWTLNGGVINGSDANATAAIKTIAGLFGQVVYFKGIANQLAAPSTTLETPPRLSQDGSGLASVLVNLMTTDRKRQEQVEQSLCAIVATVKEVNARTVTLKRKEKKVFAVNGAQVPYEEERDVPGNELIFNTASGNEIPAQEMSEGTLLTLGLLTLLHGSAPDARLFLLDDIEQGLHPLAQRKLVKTIREFAEKHDKQILLTTHSGYIIDELEPEDVWVMQTDEQGISHVKRLSEHPDAKRLLDVLTTGELADAVGEDWVLPQAPQAIAAGEAHA